MNVHSCMHVHTYSKKCIFFLFYDFFLLQQTTSAASSTPMSNTSDGTLTSQLTATSMAAENPLQKLILQLQRGQQPVLGSMGNQSLPLGGAVSMAGVPPPAAPSGGPLDASPPDQQFDAIQSLMQQLNKMQSSTPDQIQQVGAPLVPGKASFRNVTRAQGTLGKRRVCHSRQSAFVERNTQKG